MARTPGSDGARTEAAIRAAAIELIAAHGFEAVTLRDIARRAGIQASSLYRYFPSKNELLVSIISRHMDDLLARWETVSAAQGEPAERLHAFVDFHVRYHTNKPKEVFIANMELRSLAPEDRKAIVQMRKRYEDILREILAGGIEQGVFSVPDIRVATYAILAMLTGLTAWYQEGGRLPKEELVACYAHLVTRGVDYRPR